jgi:hypothetical protein
MCCSFIFQRDILIIKIRSDIYLLSITERGLGRGTNIHPLPTQNINIGPEVLTFPVINSSSIPKVRPA